MYDHKTLLDKRREGQEFILADINRALRDAGDLAEERSERMDTPIPIESEGNREAASTSMVVGSKGSDTKEAWAGWSRYLDCRDAEATT
jgi:hypothetical protein